MHPKRAELPDVNINTDAQSINTERTSLQHRLVMADPSFHIHLLQFVIHKKNVKRSGPNVENKIEYCNLLKAICRTMMDNIFLSHSYIPPKSLFSITLTLICITLPLVKFLGEKCHFVHFNIEETKATIYTKGKFNSDVL